jgi:hypothetical protein
MTRIAGFERDRLQLLRERVDNFVWVDNPVGGKLSQPPRRKCCVEGLQQIKPLGPAAACDGLLGE